MLLGYVFPRGPRSLSLGHVRRLSLSLSPLQSHPLCFTTITDGYEPFSQNLFVSECELPALQLDIYALYG